MVGVRPVSLLDGHLISMSGSFSSTEEKSYRQAISSAGCDPPTTEESVNCSLKCYVSLSLSSGGSDAKRVDYKVHRSRNNKSCWLHIRRRNHTRIVTIRSTAAGCFQILIPDFTPTVAPSPPLPISTD
jgi:hypothetical protein